MEKVYLTPQTIKLSILPPELFKTVYFTSGRFLTVVATVPAGCYRNDGVVTVPVGLNFLFLFIFGEFLKNHSKS